ncbi:zinc finger protein on ecdysone puffs-like isoform X2 [Planococcus citri]|uniref:zinc finger protein on ecdysone puffs-like isoform X2 n=1 Tax=Planococcus citri TaxID=170843 RepID=UPI0031F8CAA5
MAGRHGNMNSNRFGFGNQKKPMMQNQNRNRLSGGNPNNYSGGGLMNQVNPWLSTSNNNGSSYNNSLGRNMNIVNDPQAQLALASNLLNNLLSPSQLNNLSQPPSLLSLGNMSNSRSAYGGNQSYNRDRFNHGRPNHQGKVQKRDDFKKQDNKNKRFGNDRKNAGLKKPDQSDKKSAGDAKNVQEKKDTTTIGSATASSVTTSTVSTTDNKEEVKVDNADKLEQPVSVGKGKKKGKKAANEKKPETAKKDEDSKKTEEVKVSYSEVPPALLFCHICRKHMWDDSSFEKHLEGRPHKMMVEELDQSYKLKVDLLRHDMRVTEQQRENDIQRAQRKGKSNVKTQQRGFCTMCNLSFLGMLPAHRKNEKHQKLKKFLHPKCSACSKEFYTRLEWDDHKLTAAHLKKLAEIRKARRPDLQDSEFDIADFIEDVNDEIEAEGADIKVTGKRETLEELRGDTKEVEGDAVGNSSATAADGEGEDNADENDKEGKAEDDEEAKKLPKYSPGIPVGENFVVNKTGHLCRACNRFMLTPEDIKTHCQTVVHFNNTIKILKAQNKIVRKRRLNESTTKNDDEKTATAGNDKNAKRLKLDETASSDKELNGTVNESMEVDAPAVAAAAPAPAPETNATAGSEQYDPENPESENEKEGDTGDQQLKLDHDIKESQVVLVDIKQEARDEEPVQEKQEEPAEEPVQEEPMQTSPVKPERKPAGRSPGGRGPRARRGRR